MTIPPNTFKQYYNSLSLADKTELIEKVTAALEISESTFYRRLNMPWLYNGLERDKIAELAEIKPEYLFTPETLNQPA